MPFTSRFPATVTSIFMVARSVNPEPIETCTPVPSWTVRSFRETGIISPELPAALASSPLGIFTVPRLRAMMPLMTG
ncbi:hypothetical protein D3C72_2354710 [compost metagenome]